MANIDNVLYPEFEDPEFNKKIALKKEFNEHRYVGFDKNLSKEEQIVKIKTFGEELRNADFELAPHQMFVRNFLSLQSPFNSLLLFHDLGTGKTCSAISISEEMRDYNNQINSNKKIIIVASPNVQDNFKSQLFNENNLKLVGNKWTIRGCTGTKLLNEVNPTNDSEISKDKIVKLVNRVITNNYIFVGYTKFANKIKTLLGDDSSENDVKKTQRIRTYFDDTLVIIDEAHNIRVGTQGTMKLAVDMLDNLVERTKTMRLCLLSGTPMYNDPTEIVWMLNILNKNDNRPTIKVSDVFTKDGDFKVLMDGKKVRNVGYSNMVEQSNGYVSFVRGDNPYTFPFKIYPSMFAKKQNIIQKYPELLLNNQQIDDRIKHIEVFVSNIGSYQEIVYNYIIEDLRFKMEKDKIVFEEQDAFGYTYLEDPLLALNFVYPSVKFDKENTKSIRDTEEESESFSFNHKYLVGSKGLTNTMKFEEKKSGGSDKQITNFEYKKETLDNYGRIFSYEEIGNYSNKIKSICDNIITSKGISLIYSEHIDGGVIPMALAIEELGYQRYGKSKSLFKKPPTDRKGGYIIISGNKLYSPNNDEEIKAASREDNKNGDIIKVIIISRAGAEGIDFKCIRQIHLMEPWYNLNRPDQIVGRGVRTFSHLSLPFAERNVQIFFHGTLLNIMNNNEAVDLYIYRKAEDKSIKIGKVTRLLKENAIDCVLNVEQNNFTEEIMEMEVKQELSTGENIIYKVGDKPYSKMCDYMEKCQYLPTKTIESYRKILLNSKTEDSTYNENFIMTNIDSVINKIKQLFKTQYFYSRKYLFDNIRKLRNYSDEQIDSALTIIINDESFVLLDKFNREGNLINIGEYYFFKPNELDEITVDNILNPIDYKMEQIKIKNKDKAREIEAKKDLSDYIGIIKKLYGKMYLAFYGNEKNVKEIDPKSDEGWYKYVNFSKKKFNEAGIVNDDLYKYIIDHCVEELITDDKLTLLNTIFNDIDYEDQIERINYKDLKKFELYVKSIFEKSIFDYDGHKFIVLYNDNADDNTSLFAIDESNKLIEQPKDLFKLLLKKSEFALAFSKKYSCSNAACSNINIHYGALKKINKNSSKNIFKSFNILESFRGKDCANQTVHKTRNEVRKAIPDIDNYITNKDIDNQHGMCCIYEICLRHYNKKKQDGRLWFFTDIEHEMSKNSLEKMRKSKK